MSKTHHTNTAPAGHSFDEVFSLLANNTRIRIVQALWEFDTPTSFSKLATEVGAPDMGNFNYHLDKLAPHFVRQTDMGYELQQTGQRVVSAILSGIITDNPQLEPTKVDAPCPHCEAPIVISYAEGTLVIHCTKCGGSYDRTGTAGSSGMGVNGTIAVFLLPPAAVHTRSPKQLLQTAFNWDYFQIQALATRLCPRCAGRVEIGHRHCDHHELVDDICAHCCSRYAVLCTYLCEHCGYFRMTMPTNHIMAQPAVAAFYSHHGINVTKLKWVNGQYLTNYDEEITSFDPLRVRLVLSVDDDDLAVTLDEKLEIIEVE